MKTHQKQFYCHIACSQIVEDPPNIFEPLRDLPFLDGHLLRKCWTLKPFATKQFEGAPSPTNDIDQVIKAHVGSNKGQNS